MHWTAHASGPSRRPEAAQRLGVPTPEQLGGRCSVVEIWVRSCVQRETIPFAKTSAAREGRKMTHQSTRKMARACGDRSFWHARSCQWHSTDVTGTRKPPSACRRTRAAASIRALL